MAGGPARSRIVRPGSGSPSECSRFHSLLACTRAHQQGHDKVAPRLDVSDLNKRRARGVAELITHRYPSERFVAAPGPPAPAEIKAVIEWGAPSAPAGETVMADDIQYAPGWPGIPPRWTSSAKSAVATALSPMSRVWFTLSHGIFNEIYFPRVDQACTRDLGLVVTDGREFFAEEKRHARSEIVPLAEGVPAYRVTNTCLQGRFRVEKEILADPRGDAVLQRTWFVPLAGGLDEYHVYVLLAPHLGNRGNGNTAWVGSYKGVPMLFAERGSRALALACSVPWAKRSAG